MNFFCCVFYHSCYPDFVLLQAADFTTDDMILSKVKGKVSSASFKPFATPSTPSASFAPSAAKADDKELAAKIAALERQIKDANSEARKAPLIAQLNALRGGASSARPSAAGASKHSSTAYSGPVVDDKELASKIASLERQIKDANSEARKTPLIAQLNALKSGASSIGKSSPAFRPGSSPAPAIDNKELASKITALERQIKDANSEARRAPLIAQLNALRSGASFPSQHTSGAPKPATSFKSAAPPASLIQDKDVAAKVAALEKQIKDANSEARKATLIAQVNALVYARA